MMDATPDPFSQEAMRWRAAPPETCEWVQWGDECVLYHRPSGKTHFVNAVARRLITDVLVQPRTLDDILTRLCTGAPPDVQAAIRDSVPQLLPYLEELGLVQAL